MNRIGICRSMIAAAIVAGLLPFLNVLRAQDPPPAKGVDAFEEVDLAFRSFYTAGRAATLARLGPVIVVERGNLALIRDGQRTEATPIPPLYHRLKAISHVPLAIYVALAPFGNGPIDGARLARLREFRTRVETMAESLDGSGFDAETMARSRTLLGLCSAYLDGVLKEGSVEAARLKAMTRTAGPIVLAHVAVAARVQIDAYRGQVATWRRELSAEEWSRVRVLVLGPAMPRKHNVAVQFFAKLLGLPGESRRLVYAEETSGTGQGLDLLATHQLDGELSEAFFADPDRMEIDLLGNAASVYLDGLDLSR